MTSAQDGSVKVYAGSAENFVVNSLRPTEPLYLDGYLVRYAKNVDSGKELVE